MHCIFIQTVFWQELAGVPENQGYVVYGGEQSMQISAGSFISCESWIVFQINKSLNRCTSIHFYIRLPSNIFSLTTAIGSVRRGTYHVYGCKFRPAVAA